MALCREYASARERWTLRNQVMDDDEGTKILSPLKVQHDGWYTFFALAITLESNLRVQWKRNVTLSVNHLKNLDEDSRLRMPGMRGKAKRLLSMLKVGGVCEEEQYQQIVQGERRERHARKYKVTSFEAYHVDRPEDIRRALYQLRRGGPLLAVIRISENYDDCANSGLIYRYDPNRVVRRLGQNETHAVSVVSFGVEAKVPIFECQDSRGPRFGRNGFLAVDITSLKELYSIRVRLSSQ